MVLEHQDSLHSEGTGMESITENQGVKANAFGSPSQHLEATDHERSGLVWRWCGVPATGVLRVDAPHA